MHEICRRRFMRGAAALGAASVPGVVAMPLTALAQAGGTAAPQLPARGEFTIANAYVMTMDAGLGDIAGGAVHVRNGAIVAVGRDVAGGGLRIDGIRHDRDAGPRRYPLAHVEHAVSQLRGRPAGGRLFPDRGAVRGADDPGRHLSRAPGLPPRRRSIPA